MKRHLGIKGEQLAHKFLEENGYIILHKNWRYTHKEIDIIAQQEEILAFIEVKTRRNQANLHPHELFTKAKQRHYIECAYAYGALFDMMEYSFRFDILCIHATRDGMNIEHWRDVIDVRDIMDCRNSYWK